MSLSCISLCFGLIFWGEQFIESNVAAVIVQGLVPIGLLGFSALYGHERISGYGVLAVLLGVAGVGLLVQPTWQGRIDTNATAGVAAVIVGTLAYGWGSVHGKPAIDRIPAVSVAGLENLIGGLALLLASILFENEKLEASGWMLGNEAVASWVYLVVVGSFLGFTCYTVLLKRWGARRTSAYAFVTPVVAFLVGSLAGNEQISGSAIAGAVLISLGVAALRRG
jgi:drug/metabolite transporter (DMT)-like permease